MEKQKQALGSIRFYIRWPIAAGVFLAAASAWLFYKKSPEWVILAALTLVYVIAAILFYHFEKKAIYNELVEFAEDYASSQNKLFRDMRVPYALMLPNGRIIWMNDAFGEATHCEIRKGLTIFHLFPELSTDDFPGRNEKLTHVEMQFRGRDYRIEMSRVVPADGAPGERKKSDNFYAVYLYDETELNRYIRESEEERLVTGLIYIDNFDEMMENVEEVRQSLLLAHIDQKISQFMTSVDGICKKMDGDKYFIIFKQKYYDRISTEHFSILEDVKTINDGNDIVPTLSIGIGMHCPTLAQNYEYARTAIDMALGRGGDQAVVKERERITYFGGKTQQTGPSTRVKARVKAEALREFIMGKERVIIMGHKMADIDCLGAAMGIYRIAESLGRHAHIVLDEVTFSLRPFLDSVREDDKYEKDLIISADKAVSMTDRNTLVVVVDTNRPNYTQCPELLEKARTVVVLDHHRKGEEVIENAVLSYIEPYASSASEMVAEIMQYAADDIRVRPIEADCLFAGIMIDTNNFMTKAGVRTFEAAAYLRRCGADVTRVRKTFRDDIDSYRAKAETIRRAEVYRRDFAIARFPNIAIDGPTIIGAQAANEMLNIRGIKATFVLTQYHGSIYISARSIDEINVQRIMERMGGGGHMSTAGTQIQHTDMDEAIAALKQTIDEYLEENGL